MKIVRFLINAITFVNAPNMAPFILESRQSTARDFTVNKKMSSEKNFSPRSDDGVSDAGAASSFLQ